MKKHLRKVLTLLLALFFLLPGTGMSVSAAEITSDLTATNDSDTMSWQRVDGGTQPMYSSDHPLTIAVFGRTDCNQTRYALMCLEQMNFSEEDVDIFYIDIDGKTQSEVEDFEKEMNTPRITYCYNESENYFSDAYNACYDYTQNYVAPTVSMTIYMPTYVFTDSEGKVRKVISARSMADVQTPYALADLMESLGYGDLLPEDKKLCELKFDVTYNQTDAREMLSTINDFRTGKDAWEWNIDDETKTTHTDLGGLVYDYELEKVAMQRAAELVTAFAHQRPNGLYFNTAYPDTFNGLKVGENLAIGVPLVNYKWAFTEWREENEPYIGQGHRRNMLSENYTAIGVAHIVYQGCHYWVQEFGSSVVGEQETQANDSQTEVTIPFVKSSIKSETLKSDPASISIEVGEKADLPKIYWQLITNQMWESAPALELPLTVEDITWSCSSDIIQISEDGISALKAGSAMITFTYQDKTITIPVTARSLLEEAKEKALEELEAYRKDDSCYFEAQQEECRKIIEDGKSSIENAVDEKTVSEALQEAKDKLDAVPVKKDATLQEWESRHPEAKELHNPDVTTDPAEYSYIYFGTYPQSQITGREEETVQAAMQDMQGDIADAWVSVDGARQKYRRTKTGSDVQFFKWEPIKWRILQKDIQDETASLLLMADNGLDLKKYNDSGSAEWTDSTLREWLNNDFCNEAFSIAQQEILISPIEETDKSHSTADKVSLPSISDLSSSAYGFGKNTLVFKSRIVTPTDYAANRNILTNNANKWWTNTDFMGYAAYTSEDGSLGSSGIQAYPCDAYALACVPLVRIDMYREGVWSVNPEDIKPEQSVAEVTEEILEKMEAYEEKLSDYDDEDQTALREIIETAKNALEHAKDAETALNVLTEIEEAFKEKTDKIRVQIKTELEELEDGIDYTAYYKEQQREIEEALEKAKRKIENAPDAADVREALAEVKKVLQETKTIEALEQETAKNKEDARNKLSGYQTADGIALYDEEGQAKLKEIIEKALADIESAVDAETVAAVLKEAESAIANIPLAGADELKKAKDTANAALDSYLTPENEALYRDAEWEKLTMAVDEARKAVEAAKDKNAVDAALTSAKTAIGALKTDAQLKEEEEQASGTTTKPGTTTESGTTTKPETTTETGTATKPETTTETGTATKPETTTETGTTTKPETTTEAGTATKPITTTKPEESTGTDDKRITLKKPSISGKIKAQKKGFTVKWKKVKDVTGYEVCYSTSKKFTKKTTKTKQVKKASATQLSVKKLKGKKKYYVRIRTYKTVRGKKYYSAWSKSKTVTTKK